jgi:competence ComEA-like helix-hairpin-helix protein
MNHQSRTTIHQTLRDRGVAVFRKRVGIILIACLLPFLSRMTVPVWANSDDMSVKGQVAVGKININTAPEEELVKLKRVGPVIAGRIIEYRETHGPFRRPEDIMKVKGIGQKTWEYNKDIITVE